MDPAKLKVIELRAELQARGLDTKGVKAVLVERLREALEEESGNEVPETSIVETSTDETSLLEDKSYHSAAESFTEQEKEYSSDKEQVEQEFFEPDQDSTSEPERQESSQESQDQYREQETEQGAETQESYEEENTRGTEEAPSEQESEAKDNFEEDPKQGETEDSQDIEDSQNMEDSKLKEEEYYGDSFKEQHYEEKPDVTQYQGYEDQKKENYEADVKMESEVDVKEENRSDGQDRKRKRSSRWSPQPQQKQGWGQNQSWGRKDDEPELDDEAVTLGWYDSDLNLEIDKTNFLQANPMSSQGFGYIWAGCRATYGFNRGSVCYEVKLLENNDVTHLEDEPSPHVLRVGWSVLTASMLLGEEVGSYGYGGTGKASTNCKFSNYGTSFVVGDTVTAYLDYGEKVKMSFAVNGVHQGAAFTIAASEINNQPLFPHVLSKNIKFQANFGQSESEFPTESGYTWAAKVAADEREPGPRRPDRREDCEMLMMCGLPGCGKTTWANAYVQENPGKFYNILGTNNLIDKMKIQGLPRKRNYHGRWDVLIDKCTKCLNKLLEMAAKRRRSYILDQTNVYPSAQKRKMRNFAGFVRRAIVIVPSDEEFQRRCAKREAEEGKDIPDSAVLEMKANFKLPEVGESFDEVRYIELNEEESRPLVEQYNKEGKAAGFGQQAPFSGQGKKFKSDRPPFRGGGSGDRGFRGGRGSGFGGVMDRRDRSDERGPGGGRGFRAGGPPMKGGMDRGGRGGWQPRGGGDRGPPRGGGWRDRSPQGFDREERGGGGGPWRNNRSNDRDRPYDRNQRGRGGRPGGFDRDNYRDNDYGRGGGGGGFRDGGDFRGGYDRDEFPRGGGGGGGGGGYNSRDGGGGGFRERGGGRGGRGGGGGFDRDRGGSGRGGFDRRGGGGGGGFNDRRGGGNREGGGGGFDRNRGGSDRGPRDNKGGSNSNDAVQGQSQAQGWGNQGYNSGWGQGGGYNQGGYNQGGYNQGYNQQGNQQAAWGQQQQQQQQQQGWGNKAGYTAATNQQQPAQATAVAGATTAATGYNTTGYAQQAGYNQQYAQAQGYNWGQYGYGQGWTQNADGTYSYPQGWQQYGYNYGQPATAMATPAAAAATPAAPLAAAPK